MIITIGRKPFEKTASENAKANGCGAINIDACRIGEEIRFNASAATDNRVCGNFKGKEDEGRYCVGRFPANVVISKEVASIIDEQSGVLRARGNKSTSKGGGGMYGHTETLNDFGSGDSGGASRFFKEVG